MELTTLITRLEEVEVRSKMNTEFFERKYFVGKLLVAIIKQEGDVFTMTTIVSQASENFSTRPEAEEAVIDFMNNFLKCLSGEETCICDSIITEYE